MQTVPQDLLDALEKYDLIRSSDGEWYMFHNRLFCEDTGKWLICTDTIWRRDFRGEALFRIREEDVVNLQKRFY